MLYLIINFHSVSKLAEVDFGQVPLQVLCKFLTRRSRRPLVRRVKIIEGNLLFLDQYRCPPLFQKLQIHLICYSSLIIPLSSLVRKIKWRFRWAVKSYFGEISCDEVQPKRKKREFKGIYRTRLGENLVIQSQWLDMLRYQERRQDFCLESAAVNEEIKHLDFFQL